MKGLRLALLALGPLVSSVLGQSVLSCDTQNGVCFESYYASENGGEWGYVLPLTSDKTYTNEFIGQFTIPLTGLWAGAAFGEGMNGNLLIVAWPNGKNIVFDTRQASSYNPPTEYPGPKITTLATVFNSTYWKWTFRCQNCTTWVINGAAGSISPSFDVFGWAFSTSAPLSPSSSTSAINEHDDAELYSFNATAAQTASYGSIIAGFSGKSTTTSSIKSTSSTHSTTSTTSTHSTTSTTSTTSTKPTSTSHSTTSSSSVFKTSTSSAPAAGQTHYGQCGGTGWTGPTTCVAPYKCTVSSAYYSQCL